jgi:hypothetical protein
MGWEKWLNSNVMAALVILNSFGLMVIPQLMALGFINVLDVIVSEQRI